MQQVLHLPPAYSAAQSTYPQPSSYPTGSGNRILFPRAPGVRDPLVGFGSPVAEDWGREPIYVGTAFHPNGTQHPGKHAVLNILHAVRLADVHDSKSGSTSEPNR